MPIKTTCTGCHKSYRIKEEFAGKKIRCPSCQNMMSVPVGADDIEEMEIPAAPKRLAGRFPGRTERDYTHLSCGGTTTVDGPEFKALADPLAGMVASYCGHCGDNFSLDQFAWSDTGEKISDYYIRYSSQGSPLQNFLASRLGMYAMAGVPFGFALIGYLVSRNNWFIPAGLLLAIIVIALHTVALGPAILKRVLGTSDARELV